jgi:hypothetical protein
MQAGLRVALAGVASRVPFRGGDGRKPVCLVDEPVCGGIAKPRASPLAAPCDCAVRRRRAGAMCRYAHTRTIVLCAFVI